MQMCTGLQKHRWVTQRTLSTKVSRKQRGFSSYALFYILTFAATEENQMRFKENYVKAENNCSYFPQLLKMVTRSVLSTNSYIQLKS